MLLKILKKTKNGLLSVTNKTVIKKYQKTERKEENDNNQPLTVSFQYTNGYKALQKGLNTMVKNNDTKNKFNLRVIFKTNKISSYFSNKSKTPSGLSPNIMYRFNF